MNKFNKLILKYGTKREQRYEMKNTCDLYSVLVQGYIVLVMMSILSVVYVIGMKELITDAQTIRKAFFSISQAHEPDFSIFKAVASILNGMALFFAGLFSLVHIIWWVVSAIYSVYETISEKITWKVPKISWCRNLTAEEKFDLVYNLDRKRK